MYFQVASKLSVVKGTDGFSQAVSMAGGNGVYVDMTVFNKTASTLSMQAIVQQGNDLENWSDVANGTLALGAGTIAGFVATLVPSIAAAYVRLRYTLATASSGDTAIVGAGINVANL